MKTGLCGHAGLLRQIALAAILLPAMVPTAAVPAASVTLAVTGRANATPSIAALGSVVAVAWGASVSAGATDVYLAVSRDGGRTFGQPVRVNNVDGDAKLGGEQPPHVALVPRAQQAPAIAVIWTATGRGGTRLLSARSDDVGSSFSPATPVPGGEAAGNRGWESIAVDRNGQVVTVWLDHRDTVSSTTPAALMNHEGMNHEGMNHAAGPSAKADSVARAQLSKLYFSRVGGANQSQAIVGGVCYCCKTTLAVGPDGSIYAAWRHVYPGNVRDIAFTVSRDGGRSFAQPLRVSDDRWVLDGCPENGPSLAVDSRNRVHVVWPTLVNGATAKAEPTLALFYAASGDGRSFSPRLRIPSEGVPRHPQVAAASGDSMALVWDEGADGARRVVMVRLRGDGQPLAREVVSGALPAVYPVVASAGGASVVAWTSDVADRSVIQVRRMDDVAVAGGVRK